MDHEILDRLEGYAIVMAKSDPDNHGWIGAWDMVRFFIKQERAGINHPDTLAAIPIGIESNPYTVVPYDVTRHSED